MVLTRVLYMKNIILAQAAKASREAAAEADARAARLDAKTRAQAEDLEAAAEKLSAM